MTNSIFKSKEQYLTFREVFAASTRDKKSKSTTKENPNYGTYRVEGWLKAEHFILLNIIRGRTFYSGFKPTTSIHKLQHGANLNHGLYNGTIALTRCVNIARYVVADDSYTSPVYVKMLAEFLSPLANAITVEQLAEVIVPECELIYPTFGKGKQLMTQMTTGDIKITDFKSFYGFLEAG